jgi:hypothetical protein
LSGPLSRKRQEVILEMNYNCAQEDWNGRMVLEKKKKERDPKT